MNNFTQRVLTSIVFVIVLLGAITLGNLTASILFFLMIFLCQREFYNFFKPTDSNPLHILGTAAGLIFFIISALVTQSETQLTSFFILIPLIFIIFVAELYRKGKEPIQDIAFTILGIIYIAVPITLLHEIAFFEMEGFTNTYHYEMILGFFFLLWANDTGAYLVGRKLGKQKLFPSMSPKKTWEGSIGGAVFAILVAFIVAHLFDSYTLTVWLGMGIIVVLFGSWGDLVESMFKRNMNIKDSGKLLPGHGGVLDRFDGIFIAAPMVYFFLRILTLV